VRVLCCAVRYIRDVPGGIALYVDEGSRYVTVRNNVVDNVGVWLDLNSQDWLLLRRTALGKAEAVGTLPAPSLEREEKRREEKRAESSGFVRFARNRGLPQCFGKIVVRFPAEQNPVIGNH